MCHLEINKEMANRTRAITYMLLEQKFDIRAMKPYSRKKIENGKPSRYLLII